MTAREDGFTAEEYLKYLEADDTNRHILVEGRDDRRVFELLLRELCHEEGPIIVDSAEAFVNCHPENCRIVEDICGKVVDEPYADRLAAFVDREFREFDRALELQDRINGHKVCGRLVWSRGHSVENYLFDFSTLCDPFIAFSPDKFDVSLDLFEDVFESAVQIACAIGLAAREMSRLGRVRKSINTSMLETGGSEVRINFDGWRASLTGKLTEEEIEELFNQFGLWYDRVLEANYSVVRWMCDGHTGFRLIWAVYDLCVQLSGQGSTLKSKSRILFNVCVNSWVRLVWDSPREYPLAVFDLLGIDVRCLRGIVSHQRGVA
jgi:hypothetical protein